MARPLRPQVAGGIYHLHDRGNRRQPVVLDDEDREQLLLQLGLVARDRGWSVLAWCLMDNHYHLLVRIRDADLGDGMREINGVFAQWFNRRHGHVGHLWHGRYGSVLVTTEPHLHAELRYLALNPVKAKMVAAPEDHPWSSYGMAIHGLPSPLLDREALFGLLAPFPADAIHRYRRIVGSSRETRPPVCAPPHERGLTPLCGGEHVREVMGALAGGGRLELLHALASGIDDQRGLMVALGRTQPVISRQLRLLAAAGLVERRREGLRATYVVRPARLAEVEEVLADLRERAAGQ